MVLEDFSDVTEDFLEECRELSSEPGGSEPGISPVLFKKLSTDVDFVRFSTSDV